jgi:predicted enzyme related to lactoylglutathione lyase
MSTRDVPWEPGTPCWYDLSTPDLASAAAFYQAVFGWELMDTGEAYGHYRFCLVGARPVAGLGQAPGGVPAASWTTYLAVEDADRAADAITSHGGTVLMPPMAIGDQGRMALATDPTGAVFGIWQAGAMFGATLVNEPGGVVWNDQRSADPRAAREFYAAVFGYRYSPMEGDPQYVTVDGAGPAGMIAGIGGPDPVLPAGTPAHWMTCFAVADVDDVVSRAQAAGGGVVVGVEGGPYGRVATLRDPGGAVFRVGSGGDPPTEQG